MWKQVAPLFVIAVLVGWFMPGADPDAAPPPPVAVEQPAPPPPTGVAVPDPKPSAPTTEPGEVILNRAADGHFYAPGNADGAAVSFLVDTGASVVALTENDAAKLGLYWHPGELSVIGRGANGEVMGKTILVKRLSIGTLTAENVPAVIIPNGLHISLLGQSFLSRIAQVSIRDNQMSLKN